jgi:AraC-like DNA-binding protein
MRTINFRSNKPSALWLELLEYFGEKKDDQSFFYLPEAVGTGSVSFNKVGLDLKHFEFRMKLREEIRFNFESKLLTEDYQILVFFHGSSRAIKFNSPSVSFAAKRLVHKQGESAEVFLSLLNSFEHLPEIHFIDNQKFKCNLLFIRKKWLEEVLPENIIPQTNTPFLSESESPMVFSDTHRIDFNELFYLLKRFNETRSTERLIILGQLYQMLGDYFSLIQFLRLDSSSKCREFNDQDIRKVEGLAVYIKTITTESLPSLDDLARRTGLSKTKMCLLFRKVFGESIAGYHTQLKLEKAKEFLVDSAQNVGQIGNNLAIGNNSYFTRWFKNLTGVSPTSFRENSVSRR